MMTVEEGARGWGSKDVKRGLPNNFISWHTAHAAAWEIEERQGIHLYENQPRRITTT